MQSRLLLAVVLAMAVLPTFDAEARAQSPAASPAPPVEDGRSTFRSSIDLVTLNVTVTDGQDHYLPNLVANDFQVLEDGVPQDVTFFAAAQVPLDVALLVDTSSSMRDKLELVQQAANRFLKTLKPGDRAQIVGFNSQTRILQPLTSDLASLDRVLATTVARGGTALYTALYIALDQFMRKAPGAGVRRPAIVVLTDGMDTASLIQFDDVLERARRAGVAIYAIALVAPEEAKMLEASGRRRFTSDSDYALKTLAKETGGRAFFPLQISDLSEVYDTVASELSTQYAIGYAPRSPRDDGAFHRVLVRVLSRPDARPRTRTGYYSPRINAHLSRPEGGGR